MTKILGRKLFTKKVFESASIFVNKGFRAEIGDASFVGESSVKKSHREEVKSVKHTELNDSIIYAKRIQEAMMLKEKHLSRLFANSFILLKPKDIVSGDFYWFTKIDNRVIIAVADCTGHGIPGAFMSVLGISLMNQIVIEEKNSDVSFILQRLDHKLKKAFSYSIEHSDGENLPYDGMDIALCCVDYDTLTITYSSAQRPIYLISNGIFQHFDGSRYPIGGMNMEPVRRYVSKSIDFNRGDKLYLCTDGFSDQFGGDKNKKFMTRNFKNLLLETAVFTMENQQLALENVFDSWKKNYEQTDDVLIVGLTL